MIVKIERNVAKKQAIMKQNFPKRSRKMFLEILIFTALCIGNDFFKINSKHGFCVEILIFSEYELKKYFFKITSKKRNFPRNVNIMGDMSKKRVF